MASADTDHWATAARTNPVFDDPVRFDRASTEDELWQNYTADELLKHLAAPDELRTLFLDEEEYFDALMTLHMLAEALHLEAEHQEVEGTLVEGQGRYQRVNRIGGGGTATVWLAWDTKIKKYVALKVFDRSERTLEQALKEANAVTRVEHPNVVNIIDVLASTDPPCIVMDAIVEVDSSGHVICGQSLVDAVPNDLETAVTWIISVAGGIESAHRKWVFHRDVNPANVLLHPGDGRPVVIDFGLNAQNVQGKGVGLGTVCIPLTDGRVVAGTPGFMSPEQARGVSINLDPGNPDDYELLTRMDVFGIAALAYYVLSRELPVEVSAGESSYDLWEKVYEEQPHRHLATMPLFGDQRCSIPLDLAKVVEKGLSSNPQERYASANEFALALEDYLTNVTLRSVKRRPFGFWAGLATLLAITLAVMLAAYFESGNFGDSELPPIVSAAAVGDRGSVDCNDGSLECRSLPDLTGLDADGIANPYRGDKVSRREKAAHSFTEAAVKLFEDGDYDSARSRLYSAWREVEDPITLYNIAQTYRLEGRWKQANKRYRWVLSLSTAREIREYSRIHLDSSQTQ